MKRFVYYFSVMFFCLIAWCVLCESISVQTIISGAFTGVLTVVFILYYYNNISEEDIVNPIRMIAYYLILIVNVYIAAIKVMKIIIFKKDGIEIVETELITKGAIKSMLVANAVTLTPGTVTIDKAEGKLKVLQFCALNNDTRLSRVLIRLVGGDMFD